MALIKCPECGKEISNKAIACPSCGCPIAGLEEANIVKIKMGILKAPLGINGSQEVEIEHNSKVIWSGEVGQTAELQIDVPMDINVKYKLSIMHYGGSCSGTIDPRKSKKYYVSARQGFMQTKIVLQAADVFDSEA